MKKAAADLNFEAAAELRDKLIELKEDITGNKDIEKGEYRLTCHRKKIQDNISRSEEQMNII